MVIITDDAAFGVNDTSHRETLVTRGVPNGGRFRLSIRFSSKGFRT